jgi:hypothetical protein
MARLTLRPRRFALPAALLCSALALSACGSGGATDQARTACKKVDRSLAIYKQATAEPIPANTDELQNRSQALLLSALGDAARATSADGSFNALMTTLSEATRVPEGLLVASLSRQCKVVMSDTPYLAQ